MAKFLNYNLFRAMGASGKFGDVVFKQTAKGLVVTKAPRPRRSSPSLVELKVREHFSKGIRYAQKMLRDPALKAIYQAGATGGQSAFNVAMKDFSKAPVIHSIDTSACKMVTGGSIEIDASDNFKVAEVTVEIECYKGKLLESGTAIQQGNSNQWTYTLTKNSRKKTGCKIKVAARDLAGNVTTREEMLGV